MADTVDIDVFKDDGWTEVISSGGGFFSASKSCQYCFAQSQPAESFYGHRLGTSELNIYWIPAFEKMYVKADQDLVLVVSEELEVVQRILITLNGVDEYFTFQNTKTFPDDFDLSIDAVLPISATTVTLFGQTASADHYIKVLSTGFASINIDTSIVTSTVLATKGNKQMRYGVRLVGDDFIFTEDDIAIDTVTDAVAASKILVINALCQSNGADFFNGTPSDPILTDLTTASNSESWQLNRDLPANTEQSSSGANILTYIAATRDLFTFNSSITPNQWVGSTERLINGGFDNGLTGWTVTLDGQTVEVVGGRLHIITDGTSAGAQQDTLKTGESYLVEFNYEAISGELKVQLGSDFVTFNTSGFKSELFRDITSSGNLFLFRSSGAAEGFFDNVSAKRIIEIA